MSDEEEDFLRDLELDLGDEEVSENEDATLEAQDNISVDDVHNITQASDGELSVEKFLKEYRPFDLSDFKNIKPDDISRLTLLGPEISQILSRDTSDLSKLLVTLNSLSTCVQQDITLLHDYMRLIYHQKFPELEDLISSPLQYADIVCILEKEDDCNAQDIQTSLENEAKLTREQILVVSMSIKTSFRHVVLESTHKSYMRETRAMIRSLFQIQDQINEFIMSKVSLTAPNVCALVGPKVTSLLISHAGGILQLSQIPSCNLASIGKKKHLSHELHTSITGVRQEGYIYLSPLIQSQPSQFHKKMLRMVCAKVCLAARVDAGIKNSSNLDMSLGTQWKDEILEKILKIQDTSATRYVKPLPIPVDMPKKKRAGRKFRKYKEQFQLSHLRQLQNRVEFGKQEQTITDSYGEEIGLGMTKSALHAISGSSVSGPGITKRTVNNSAKLTKSMKKRIEEANEQTKDYLSSLDNQL